MYKKQKQYPVIKIILIVGLFILFYPKMTHAEDTNAVGFNYQIEYPSNQIGGDKGFFDLKLDPGEEQTINIKLSNSGKKDVTVDLSLNGAKTNSNGVIDYGPTDIENDKSLKFPFEKIVSAPKEVVVKPGEVKNVPIKIKMPETSFDGIILGGLRMIKAEEETKEEVKGATVRNTYSYIVAIRLQNNEKEVKPKIEINSAAAAQLNYRNSIVINLSNVNSALVKDKVDIETQVTKKGSKEVLYERKQTGMSMAPNTQMDFYVSMGGERMIPGDYTANVLATIGDEKWEKSIDFKITKEDADKYNKRDVGLVQDRGLDWKMVILIVAGFLVVVVVIFIIIKVVKNKKNTSTKSSKNKKSRKK